MSSDTYELLALAARYWFVALAVIVVFRAWRCTVLDNRHAKVLRDWTPDTGCVGELIVISGGGRARKGARFPVPKEGLVGSGRRADVRVVQGSVWKRHARLDERQGGILLTAVKGAPMALEDGELSRQIFLRDGDRFYLGTVLMTLVLYDAQPEEEPEAWQDEYQELNGQVMDAPEAGAPEGDEFWDE